MSDLPRLRTLVNSALAEARVLRGQNSGLKERHAKGEAQFRHLSEAQTVIQEIAQQVQRQAHAGIAAIVTRCLHAIYDDPYDFDIRFDKKAGKTSARLVFVRDGNEYDANDVGGGVVDVAAFAMRVAALMMSKPTRRKFMFLDEPFRHLDRGRMPRVKVMVEELAKQTGIQFVIITHAEELQAGEVINITSPARKKSRSVKA